MFGLSDLFGVPYSNSYFRKRFADRKGYFDITVQPEIQFTGDNTLWICFPGFLKPKVDIHRAWGIHNLFPKQGTVVIVEGPDAIAGYTPAMQLLDQHVRSIIKDKLTLTLNVFSLSAGTFPGFYFANKYAAGRLIAIAPGPRMGEGIYTSVFSTALRDKCIEAGFPTAREYDRVIAEFNQENNIAHLPSGRDLLIFGGRCDRVIRNWGTREIAQRCFDAGKMPQFRNYPLLGHTSLGGWLALKNKLGLDPYGIKACSPYYSPSELQTERAKPPMANRRSPNS